MKKVLFILFAVCACFPAFAQNQNTDIGIMLGGSNYLGELAPDLAYNETKPSGAFFVRNRLSPFFALRHSLSYARVAGHDANFEFNRYRNLSFRSSILEMSSVVEFNFLPFSYGRERLTKDFTTYVFAGLGFFRFNPKARIAGKWQELRPLGTEGENLPGGKGYNLISVAIPFGFGCKYKVNNHWVFGWELGFRRTYTDYLDDVSDKYPDFVAAGIPGAMKMSDRSWEVNGGKSLAAPGDIRGNPQNKDWYIISGFTLSYRITPPEPCNNKF